MAAAAAAALALFMELRQRSQSGLLIIRELIPESWPVDITVMPSSIEIKMGEDCKALSLPPEVMVVPPSCRGLQYVPGDGLHMRLLFQADLNTKSLPAVGESLKPKKRCTFYCQSCGESIISNQTFLRVLPLPSEDWNDLVDEWCCHPNPFNNSILQPQNGDCFLGPNYFLVNSGTESGCSGSEILNTDSQGAASKSSDSALNSKTNSRIICKRCKTLLGEIMLSGHHLELKSSEIKERKKPMWIPSSIRESTLTSFQKSTIGPQYPLGIGSKSSRG